MFVSFPIGEILNSSKAMKGLAILDTNTHTHTKFSLKIEKRCFEIVLFLHDEQTSVMIKKNNSLGFLKLMWYH